MAGRADRLRGQRCARQADGDLLDPAARDVADTRAGVPGAEGVDAVEVVLRAAVPEVAEVEDRVDRRRRVAARGAAHVDGADGEIAVRRSEQLGVERVTGEDVLD